MNSSEENKNKSEIGSDDPNWIKGLFYIYLHIMMLYGILMVFTEAYYTTAFYTAFLIILGMIGINAGAHRLWAHGSYTATTELKIFLMLCQTLAGQGTIYDWVLYHRLHHKCYGTSLDPFNPTRGFLYSHLVCLTKDILPEQEKLLNEIDVTDLENDRVVQFQKKYYWYIFLAISIISSIYIPIAFWGEYFLYAALVSGFMRYAITSHFAWFIYSAVTILGLKQGEKFPSDTNLVFLAYKTHWLKYHQFVPWDYQTGEYGKYGTDWISYFIRVCAALELATNLRIANSDMVKSAIYMHIKSKKSIPDCLMEIEENSNVTPNHYLDPKKYY